MAAGFHCLAPSLVESEGERETEVKLGVAADENKGSQAAGCQNRPRT